MTPAFPVATSRRHRLDVIIPVLLSLISSFLVLEFGLRHFYRLIPLPVCASSPILATYYCQPYFVYDKPIEIAYRYRPNLRLEGWWNPADPYLTDAGPETRPTGRDDSFYYVLTTDDMGFPNPAPAWQDEYDIIISGDSFTIPTAPNPWIDQLRQQTGADILTLGAPSWSTLNEAAAIKKWGLDKNPEWVIVMYFEGNDLINTAQYLDKQSSGLDWREYDLAQFAWWQQLITVNLLRYAFQPRPEPVEPVDYRYPVTATTAAGPVETVFKDLNLLSLSADYDTLARSDEFAAVSRTLLDLDDLVADNGGRLLLVYIPSKAHVYWSQLWDERDVNHILERTVTVTLSEGEHGRLLWNPGYLSYTTFQTNHNAQERLFADFAAANEIEWLNLTPVLWQATLNEGAQYHYADVHWNQPGNDLVAATIAAYLETHR